MGKFDTHGGYFAPQDYFRINTGGSHKENPNGGVQVGVDQNGIPNLLEENEPVYNDFVYSDNIKAKGGILEKHNLPIKYADMLYSEIADRYIETAENRPLSAIERNTLRVMLSRLAEAQEEQKERNEIRKAKRQINKLSSDELAQLGDAVAQAQQPQQPIASEMIQQSVAHVAPQPMMAAYGGLLRRYEPGGPLGGGYGGGGRGVDYDTYEGAVRDNTSTPFVSAQGYIPDYGKTPTVGRLDEGPMGMVPVVGDALSVGQAVRDAVNGDYVSAAMLPFSIIAGETVGKGASKLAKKVLSKTRKSATAERRLVDSYFGRGAYGQGIRKSDVIKGEAANESYAKALEDAAYKKKMQSLIDETVYPETISDDAFESTLKKLTDDEIWLNQLYRTPNTSTKWIVPENGIAVPLDEIPDIPFANGGLLRKFGDGTPGEVERRKPNWEKVAGIATGVAGGAGLGALQGSALAGVGAIPGAILGGISGGMMASDLYNKDYLGAALDVATMGAGTGLIKGGRQLFGIASRSTSPTLATFESTAKRALAQAAKRDARDTAVKVANEGVDTAVKALSDNTKALGSAGDKIVELYSKDGALTAAEKKALKKAEEAYVKSQSAEKGLIKAVNQAQRGVAKAEVKRAAGNLGMNISDAAKGAVSGIKSATMWGWDKPVGFMYDPTRGGTVARSLRTAADVGTIGYNVAHETAESNAAPTMPDMSSGDAFDISLDELNVKALGGKVNRFDVGGARHWVDENGTVDFITDPRYMYDNLLFGSSYPYLPQYGRDVIHVPYMYDAASDSEGMDTTLAEQIAAQNNGVIRTAGRGYLPYDNTNGFKYYSNGAYDDGYLDWLTSRKFQEDQALYNQLASYFKATTGATLTPEEAVRLGMDEKFGRFHSIMGQGYANYLSNSVNTPSVPLVDMSPSTALAANKPTKTRVEIIDGVPVEVPVTESPNKKSRSTRIEIIDGMPVEVPVEAGSAAEETQPVADPVKGKPNDFTVPVLSTLPRYAGIGMNALAAMYNLAQKPDRYKFAPMGAYYPEGNMPQRMQEYMPLDVSIPMAAARQQGNATSRAIGNSGAGPSAGGLFLANGFNTANAEGNAFGQGWLQNWQQKNAVTGANNQALAQQASFDGQMSTQKANALNRAAMYNWRNGLQTQMLNNQADQAKASAVGASLDNLASGLVGIGTENFRMNQINNNPALYQVIGPDGKPIYVGSQRGCGGFLKTYKK